MSDTELTRGTQVVVEGPMAPKPCNAGFITRVYDNGTANVQIWDSDDPGSWDFMSARRSQRYPLENLLPRRTRHQSLVEAMLRSIDALEQERQEGLAECEPYARDPAHTAEPGGRTFSMIDYEEAAKHEPEDGVFIVPGPHHNLTRAAAELADVVEEILTLVDEGVLTDLADQERAPTVNRLRAALQRFRDLSARASERGTEP